MAIAVSVLAGALTVGESVRASLRGLVFQRLGKTEQVLSGASFFRQELARELGGVPVIALEGIASSTGRRARVQVWGVDERFWRFHSREPRSDGVFASEALAREIGARPGDAVQLRFERPSAIPVESLHGRKEDALRGVRLTLAGTLGPDQLGEFSLRPQQGAVRCLFVPLRLLERQLDRRGRANLALFSRPVAPAALKDELRLEDLGIRLRPLSTGFAVESESTILSDALAGAAPGVPIYTYLANTIRSGGRAIPYSLIAATGQAGVSRDGIALNEWAARELRTAPGDPVDIEYFVWDSRLETRSARFRLERILPMHGLGADRELAPEYPGITDSNRLSDWDPPFPVNLSRIRPADEQYWRRYRAAPKAFLALARGQELWATRFGKLTSIRVEGEAAQIRERLRAAINPADFGLALEDVRAKGLDAAAGATDFGEYFAYFSFVLVVAALLLAGLFFRFGIEQRTREIGAFRALGFAHSAVVRLLLLEAVSVAVLGGVLGVAGAIGYAALIVYGLRTWWVDAVGTTLLSVHVSAAPVVYGVVGGIGAATLFALGALQPFRRASPRMLLASWGGPPGPRPAPSSAKWAGFAALVAAVLLAAGAPRVGQTAAFFGAGGLLLAGLICLEWIWLARPRHRAVETLPGLGFRNATHRPGRSVLTVALIGAATFVIVSVDSFRRDGAGDATGLIAESVLPIYQDLNTESVRVQAFRVRPGDDASCRNLYRPQNPRIIAPPRSLLKEHPWRLLDSPLQDGAIPAIADANSLRYVIHRDVGDVIEVQGGVRLRFVGALSDSVFQSEVIISPENFVRAFPREEGFRMFLIDGPAEIASKLEEELADYGFDAVPIREKLAAFHRVENTYLSTFQALGALGLLLGTAGLGAVLLRNVLERRRETALLRAVGYTPARLRLVLLSESLLLLAAGLATGTVPALVAIAPAWLDRGGRLPLASLAALLGAVLIAGLAASLAALRLALRSPLLSALRSE